MRPLNLPPLLRFALIERKGGKDSRDHGNDDNHDQEVDPGHGRTENHSVGFRIFLADIGHDAVVLGCEAPSVGPVIQVIKKTTMPDGQDAFQLQVLSV